MRDTLLELSAVNGQNRSMHHRQRHCLVTAFAAVLLGLSSCTSLDGDSDRLDPASSHRTLPEEFGVEDEPEVAILEVIVDEVEAPVADLEPGIKMMGPWVAGDQIDPGRRGVKPIEILQVHANGSGEVCGPGKRATLRYVARLADGSVLDPGTRPLIFRIGRREAIDGWDIVVAKMRVGDSFTLLMPQELAYGPSRGDLLFDMELLSFQ